MYAAFDMNETMLSLAPVKTMWDRHIPGAHREWFARLLHLSLVANETDAYVDFTSLGGSALRYVCEANGYEHPDLALDDLKHAMAGLTAHPDVRTGLEMLRDSGWTMVTLTNSTSTTAVSSLATAGLDGLFDQVLTVEAVAKYKPDPAPYQMAAAFLGKPVDEIWMVASHDWDLAGARRAGMRTAYVRRDGLPWASIYEPPDVAVDDFVELADRLAVG